MILFQAIIEVLAVTVLHTCPQGRSDRAWIAVVAIRRHPVGDNVGDGLSGLEERHCGRHIAMLAEHHIDQRAVAIDGAVEIAPVPVNLDVRLVDIPTFPDLAAPATAQPSANAGVSLASQSRTAS